MSKFAIVLDSAADLPARLVEKYDLHVVPLHVTFGTTEYSDGVDIQIGEFLDRLETVSELPITSQPAPADFINVYNALADEGYTEILSIHLSAALSGTYECARTVAAAVAEERGIRIEAIDSRSATVGQGAMVLEAACIAQAGGTMDEAIERVKNIRRTHKIYFIPDSLTNLVKGGRASKFQGLATSVLNLKIVVSLTETGAIEVLHKAKGMKNAVNYIVKLMAERTREVGPSVYYKLHTKAYKALEYMDRALEKVDAPVRFLTVATIGPTIATHVGLHAVGLFTYPEEYHNPELDDIAEYLTPEF
ncbi:DegV family protein [[Collinsella] massiliensis]|uniref:EDD domain protein n=1 Tax=[Collinsella] massiliensis TaxID=1232426 RepID=A0A1Y3XSX1_9ACTN|nr:DegV family protein [[Collinsella] massiliensis]OUN88585.1 EDD domain protein [[Collinsella] massiliensis]